MPDFTLCHAVFSYPPLCIFSISAQLFADVLPWKLNMWLTLRNMQQKGPFLTGANSYLLSFAFPPFMFLSFTLISPAQTLQPLFPCFFYVRWKGIYANAASNYSGYIFLLCFISMNIYMRMAPCCISVPPNNNWGNNAFSTTQMSAPCWMLPNVYSSNLYQQVALLCSPSCDEGWRYHRPMFCIIIINHSIGNIRGLLA